MCELLVGLPAVRVIGVADLLSIEVTIETPGRRPECCGREVHGHGTRTVRLVDLPVFGRASRLVWRKRRWRCPTCGSCSTDLDPDVGSPKCVLTTRAAKWATVQVGHHGRSVAEVAGDLGADWHAVMDAVALFGEFLIDDPDRVGHVTAVGLDETLFARLGPFKTRAWSTQIVDVRRGQLLDVVAGRDAAPACAWFADRPEDWLTAIEWATLDLSASYRSVYDTILPHAAQVADPFHVVRLANQALDECRRRTQNDTLGHRGRRDDPLYRARHRLLLAAERLSTSQTDRVRGLLRAGDPHQEVWFAYCAKELVRETYTHTNPVLADEWVAAITRDFVDPEMPAEVRRLGRTIGRWAPQITAWHRSHVTNGPTEAVNNLAKRIKRTAFGLTNFRNHRIRCLLYAGKPNWDLLATIQP